MDPTLGYAIALGGLFLSLILVNLLHVNRLTYLAYFPSFARNYLHRAWRYLIYPYLVHRHRFLPPFTLADLLSQLIYIAGNSFCLAYGSTIEKAGLRAGTLSLINLTPLFFGPHLSFAADVLGLSLGALRNVHRSAGLVSAGLVMFHTAVAIKSRTGFGLSSIKNVSAVVAGSALGLAVLLSWPPFRRHLYEVFLRFHQTLALLVIISSWLHVPSTRLPRFALYISFAIFGLASLADGWLLVRRSVALTRRKDSDGPRVIEIFKHQGNSDKTPIQLTLLLKEQLKMKAGQYINMWIPSIGFLSRIQSHPFVVTSWTGKRQSYLEFVIEPRGSWTRKLHSRAMTVSGQNGGVHRVFFTGPHGMSPPVDEYEYVFMVASGYGIVAHLPLLERLVQGTRAREVRARRIRLVWEFADVGLFNTVYPLLNWILAEDRKLEQSCTLKISLHTELLEPDQLGHRAEILRKGIPIREAFEVEVAELDGAVRRENDALEVMGKKRAQEIERGRAEIMGDTYREAPEESVTMPICTRIPRLLVLVSASTKIRDELRSVVGNFLDREVRLAELDYQPSE